MQHPTFYSKQALNDIGILLLNNKNSVYRTIQNLLAKLDGNINQLTVQNPNNISFWHKLNDDAKKIVFMLNGLIQTYGVKNNENSILNDVISLQKALEAEIQTFSLFQNFQLSPQPRAIHNPNNHYSNNAQSQIMERPQTKTQVSEDLTKINMQQQIQNVHQAIEQRLSQYQKEMFNNFLYPLQEEVQLIHETLLQQNMTQSTINALRNFEQINKDLGINQQHISEMEQLYKKLEIKMNQINQKCDKSQQFEQLLCENQLLKSKISELEQRIQKLEDNMNFKLKQQSAASAMQESQANNTEQVQSFYQKINNNIQEMKQEMAMQKTQQNQVQQIAHEHEILLNQKENQIIGFANERQSQEQVSQEQPVKSVIHKPIAIRQSAKSMRHTKQIKSE